MNHPFSQQIRTLIPMILLLVIGLAPNFAAASVNSRFLRDPTSGMKGVWAGVINVDEDEVAIRIRITNDKNNVRVTLPHFGWYDILAKADMTNESLRVDMILYGNDAQIELERAVDSLSGRWNGWGAEGDVKMDRSDYEDALYTQSQFRFTNEGHTFDATLVLPHGEGPFPAVVWSHGSGPITTEDPLYRSHAVWLVEHGIAALIYDKRPPHPGAGIEMLARDAAAGARALAKHQRIMPDQVGVGGLSQGGWVAPIAASISDEIGFVVGMSAPAVSPAEQNEFNQYNRVRNAFGDAAASEASLVLRQIYQAFRSGDGAKEAKQALEDASREPWFGHAMELTVWHRRGLPPVPWIHRAALDLDPEPYWRSIKQPVVCVWGSDDLVVPPHRSRELIEQWFDATGHTHHSLVIAPRAHHDLRNPPRSPWVMGAMPTEMNAIPRFIKGLSQEASKKPSAKRVSVIDSLHGIDVTDPYDWLELESHERETWIRAQDSSTRRELSNDPIALEFRDRMIELSAFAPGAVPTMAQETELSSRRIPGENYSEIWAKTITRTGTYERLLVDPHNHPSAPDESVAIGSAHPSPDGRYAYYGASSKSMPQCVRIVEIASGSDLTDDAILIRHWPWRVSWRADSKALYYVDGNTVRCHTIGTQADADQLVFESTDTPRPHLAVRASADGTMLFVTAFHPEDDTTKIYVHELGEASDHLFTNWRDLVSDPPGMYQVVGNRDSQVFVYTTHDAPNGRIIAIELNDKTDPIDWHEVVPEHAEAVYDNNHPMRPTAGMFGERLVLLYAREGRLLLRVYDFEGNKHYEIEHESFGQHESGLIGDPRIPIVRYDERGMFDPGTAYEMDLITGTNRIIANATVPFDPDEYLLTRHTYFSDDGVEIPVFLASKKGFARNGSNPVLVTNWAVAGLVVRPMYRPEHHAWIERGGVIALPAARGSGEYGVTWQRAGTGRNKVRAIDDIANCAMWLTKSGISRYDRIGMLGASLNAAASAGTVVRHTHAFGAALIQIPRIDLITERWAIEEYGDIQNPDDFVRMLEWLPLTNTKPGLYPPFLVQVGSADTVTKPFHGYKLAASLQHAQLDETPVHLHVVWGAGHSQGNGVPTRCETLGLHYAFLARALNLDR